MTAALTASRCSTFSRTRTTIVRLSCPRHVLRARSIKQSGHARHLGQAVDLFEQALALDPQSVEAKTLLSRRLARAGVSRVFHRTPRRAGRAITPKMVATTKTGMLALAAAGG